MYKDSSIILQEKRELSRKDRIVFGHALMTVFFLNIITSAFLQGENTLFIIHTLFMMIFIILHTLGLREKGKEKREPFYTFTAFFVNITPFIIYLASRLLGIRDNLLLYNQLGLSVVIILATQFLRNKKVFNRVLIMASAGWLLILLSEALGRTEGDPELNSHILFMGIIIIGTGLFLLSVKYSEKSKIQTFHLNRTMDFLVQSGNIGLFVLDFENDKIKGNTHFYHHMGSDSTAEEQSILKDIFPHINEKDHGRYYDLLDRIKRKESLPIPLEIRVYSNKTQFRWIRVDGQLNQDSEGNALFMGSTTDIDDLKRSEEKAHAYAAAVQASMMTGKISIWEFDLSKNHFITGENSFSSQEDLIMDRGKKIFPFESFLSRVHRDSRDLVRRQFQEMKEGIKDRFNTDYLYHLDKTDTMTWLKDFGVVSFHDELNHPLMITGYTLNIDNDIRESKKIDRALRASRFVPWTWNVKDKIAEFDINYTDLLGFPLQKTSFTSMELFDSMLHPLDVPKIKNQLYKNGYEAGRNPDPSEFMVFRMCFDKNKKYYWMESQITEIYYNDGGESVLIEGITRNITREREQSLLLEARKKENDVAEAKNRFFSTLSHELRTPMNIIQGMTAILSQSELDLQQKDTLGKIEESSELLLSIINDLLEFSLLNNKKTFLDIQAFSLRELLEEIKKEFHETALIKGLNFEVNFDPDLPVLLLGDRGKIYQVLKKLVDNGIKFTPRGKVTLNCHLQEQMGDDCTIKFSVIDQGIGIPKEKKNLLFKPFYMVDDRESRRHGGSGLGLAISSHLLDMMNSKIDIKSTPGEGSHFFFELSMKMTQEPDESDGKEIRYPGSRVLVVDDNPLNREIALDILKHAGIRAITASGGQEALDLMASEKPELVFMDIQMPLMDGLTATRIQRERESGQEHIPIVAMTANATAKDREMSFNAGMDGHLTKPLILKKIHQVLDYWLSDHKEIRDKRERGKDKNPSLPGVDMAATLERFAGEYSSLIMLIKEFINNYKDMDKALIRLSDQDNQEELHRRIHALKGVSGSLGIEEVYQLSHILTVQYRENKKVKKSDLEHLTELIKQFCGQMDTFLTRENL